MAPPETEKTARAIAAEFGNRPDALLEILHRVQAEIGYVPEETVPALADALNLSRAEVHGVVSYYHHFRSAPGGRRTVRICRAEACQAMGADALVEHAQRHLGCKLHETSADGAVTLEAAYCLGLCASSPALMIDETPHARVTPQRFDALVAAAAGETR